MRYFDLHCDTPFRCFKEKLSFCSDKLAVTPFKGVTFSEWLQCFAIWVDDNKENPYEYYRCVLNGFKNELLRAPKNLTPIITLEGGAVIENCIDRLQILRTDGVRLITLTWNGKNNIASGANAAGGLTPFGADVIKQMNALKIGCDLSHLNSESFWGALEKTDYPIATHSCCSKLFECPRNLSDAQIKAIAEKGGVIGVCFYPAFLGEGDVFEALYRNIHHILDLGLESSIAIGSDFDGADMSPKLSDLSKIPLFYRFLEQKGLSNSLLDKIFFENAKNFFSKL